MAVITRDYYTINKVIKLGDVIEVLSLIQRGILYILLLIIVIKSQDRQLVSLMPLLAEKN